MAFVMICPVCDGNGKVPSKIPLVKSKSCRHCKGKGKVEVARFEK